MTTRKNAAKAATPVAATSVAIVQPEYSRADMIKRLADADAKERVILLSGLVMGEVAALGGIVGKIATSVNEVLAIKLAGLHGNDWVAIARAMPGDLCEADKTRRKAILASLEGIRETVKANTAGDNAKARDVLRKVKDWGSGIAANKTSNPKGNTKMPIKEFLLDWPTLPSIYRRLMKDEGTEGDEMVLGDAIAAYFKAKGIQARAVLECSGELAWNK